MPRRASSPSPRRAASPSPRRATSPRKPPKSKPTAKKPTKAAAAVAEREAALASARAELSFFRAPLTILRLFTAAATEFAVSNLLAFVTSKVALSLLFPLGAAWAATRHLRPELYTAPDCLGGTGGLLYYPQLYVYEGAWWLVLGVLSSIGLGTGLHSGIMFLWPFCMSVILRAEACGSTAFSAMYNHPCSLQCEAAAGGGDGTLTFFNTLLLLWPSVVLWGSGTAIGEGSSPSSLIRVFSWRGSATGVADSSARV